MEGEIGGPGGPQVPSWQRHQWLEKATLESVLEVNEEVLRMLGAQSLSNTGQSPLLRDVRSLLEGLDSRARRRAAASAVLLVDVGFADPALWSEAIVGAVNDRAPTCSAPFFTVEGTLALMRLVTTQAWHLARSEPAAARLLFGLSAANLTVIGGCTLSRLMRLAEARVQWLRPRWESRSGIWCDLLRAAGEGQTEALQRMRVRGLQLLAAEARQG